MMTTEKNSAYLSLFYFVLFVEKQINSPVHISKKGPKFWK